MKTTHVITALVAAMLCHAAVAQTDVPTVGEIERLENKLTIKRLNDELLKPGAANLPAAEAVAVPSANAAGASKALAAPSVEAKPYVAALYGVSNADGTMSYHGQLNWNGRIYPIRKGVRVAGYQVRRLTVEGAVLAPVGQRGKGGHTVWAPML
ncbi:hypothetical protein UB46_29285 [Burkholderiaceae bacterium 16]|nr:hypothetical protein UB46_29285 [Burkholderiaceae bacterium 16]